MNSSLWIGLVKRPGRHRWRLGSLVLAALLVVVPMAVVAEAGDVSCGDTITTDLRFVDDMQCPSNGLVIGADGVTIDLRGHTLAGGGIDAFAFGIYNPGFDNVTIRGGTITGFLNGVMLVDDADRNTIRELVLVENGSGVWIDSGSDDARILHNQAVGNTWQGVFASDSEGHDIVSNTAVGNNEGIVLWRADGSHIVGNRLAQNAFAGINISSGDGNVVADNTVDRNAAGMLVQAGSQGNLVANNRISDSFDNVGLSIQHSDDTTVTQNLVTGHTTRGISVFGSTDTQVRRNTANGNLLDGIRVWGGSIGSTVIENQASSNGDDGIDTDEASSTLTGNITNFNGDLGIEAVPGVVDGGGNLAANNGNLVQCTIVVCSP